MDEVRNRRPFFTCSKRKLGEGVVPATQWKFNMHTTNDDLESRKVGSGPLKCGHLVFLLGTPSNQFKVDVW